MSIIFNQLISGDYVQLYLPDYDIHEVAEVPLVGYRDVLMPLKKLSYNKMVSSIPMGVNFAVFAVQLKDPKEFKIYGVSNKPNKYSNNFYLYFSKSDYLYFISFSAWS
jgi:hypothetical protein